MKREVKQKSECFTPKNDFVPLILAQIHFLYEIAKDYNNKNRVVKVDVTALYNKELSGCKFVAQDIQLYRV